MAELTKRYVSKGEPLNPQQLEILHNLIEEASEVIHAASKILRFGNEDTSPVSGASNTYELGLELGQLQFMIELITSSKGFVVSQDLDVGREQKFKNLAVYSEYLP